MKIFDPKYETLRAEELRQLQLERLQALLVRLRRNVRRYRELLGDTRLESLSDLARLPITQPLDLAGSFPYGMFALPLREVIRLQSSVGPDGRQLVAGHTRNDLALWGRLVARQLVAIGLTANDVIQISLGDAHSGSAFGFGLGAQAIGASVIAEDPFHIDFQLASLQNYRPTVLITTPTKARQLTHLLNQRRIDPQSLHLRTVLLSRPVPPAEREELQAGLFASVQCKFGIPEILDPGFCLECSELRFHVNEDQFLAEIQNGELLVTTLAREATPLLRYATRVSAELLREKCPCGRTGAILRPGPRLDHQLCIDELPIYEPQVREVLLQTRAAAQPVHLRVEGGRLAVVLQVTDRIFNDTIRSLEDIQLEVKSELLSRLGIEADVHLVSPRAGA